MDNQRSLLLNWNYLCQDKSMDELTKQYLYLTMELQETRLRAQDELRARDEQISQLQQMLAAAVEERDKAQETCRKFTSENTLLRQTLNNQKNNRLQHHHSADHHSGLSSFSDHDDNHHQKPRIDSNNGFSSSDCDESIVSSPVALSRPLPEKGKLLEAVMKAGPLLQTLLLAGPLPEWRHPPPPLDPFQIPPPPVVPPPSPIASFQYSFHGNVNNGYDDEDCGRVNRKRGPAAVEGGDYYNELKYQRIVLQ